MITTGSLLRVAAASAALVGLTSGAFAGGSVKDDAAPEGRKFTYSWNIGATTDYVFRGVSQNKQDPAFFLGADIGYGIFYAGVWGSQVDFGTNADGTRIGGFGEIDWYAGIKPVWGPVTFDLGVIYYTYPGMRDGGPAGVRVFEQDYVELKVGASGSFVKNLTTGVTVFWSPEYQGNQDEVTTVEGAIAYELPKTWIFTPTIGGVIGGQFGEFKGGVANPGFVLANGKDSLTYWNVGLALAVDKLTLDFRYWDNNIDNTGPVSANLCKGTVLQCDERFVFTAKITF